MFLIYNFGASKLSTKEFIFEYKIKNSGGRLKIGTKTF